MRKSLAVLLMLLPIMTMGARNISPIVEKDALEPLDQSRSKVRYDGFLGRKLDLCVSNRLMAQDVEKLLDPFRNKPDGNWGFRCEFWGKWFTAAVLGYAYDPTPENFSVIEGAVKGLVATQDANGYIGTYTDENHLGDWDIWGRKYVMLGLLAYYDVTKDAMALEAARKVADNLVSEVGPGSGKNIAETGWIGWKGLASSSVLEPVVKLYQLTSDPKYLSFAEYIVSSWSHPNKLTPTGLNLIGEALSDKPMWEVSGAPKAYEMMSCFEGLVELYRATGKKEYLDAVLNLHRKIVRDELMIVGSGSIYEIWCHGAFHQTEPMYQGLETCVTATWMKLNYQLLRMTGDPKYADCLEKTLYNAMLASMSTDGSWFSYYSGLMGERTHSHLQFSDVVMSCCVANGPRGLMTTPFWGVMKRPDGGIVINTYAPSTVDARGTISIEGSYPEGGDVTLTLSPSCSETFPLLLRIPSWSRKTVVKVCGKEYQGTVTPGEYLEISRKWKRGDRVEISFDMTARVVDAPSGIGDRAIEKGPVVLAFDTRLVPKRNGVDTPPMLRYEFASEDDGSIKVEMTENPDSLVWMTFNVPCRDEGGNIHHLPMCDYQSAGNTWKEGNLFRTWIPQPFDYRHLYVNNLDWRVNVTDGGTRPEIPEIYRVD